MHSRFPPPPVKPMGLTDSDYEIVLAAAAPLERGRREAFLQEVVAALATAGELGPGRVHRVCAQIQRRHFDPPLDRMVIGGSRAGSRKSLGASAAEPLD
jgi:hypothetical protein